jgi:hypothetical protein
VEQVLPGGQGVCVCLSVYLSQITYTYVSKCKNDRKKVSCLGGGETEMLGTNMLIDIVSPIVLLAFL